MSIPRRTISVATVSRDTTEQEARDKYYQRAADNFASAAILGGTGTVLSVTGFGASVESVLILWGAVEGVEGGVIYFYCRFKCG